MGVPSGIVPFLMNLTLSSRYYCILNHAYSRKVGWVRYLRNSFWKGAYSLTMLISASEVSTWKNSRRRLKNNISSFPSWVVQGCQTGRTSKGKTNREQIFGENYKTF